MCFDPICFRLRVFIPIFAWFSMERVLDDFIGHLRVFFLFLVVGADE